MTTDIRSIKEGLGGRLPSNSSLNAMLGKWKFRWFSRVEFFEDTAETWADTDFKSVLVRRRRRAIERRDSRAEVYASIHQSVDAGASLLKALSPFITATDRMILSAYEPTGQIDTGLNMAATVARQLGKLRRIAAAATIYPTIAAIAAVTLMTFFGSEIFPGLAAAHPLSLWPWWAQLFVATGQFFRQYGVYLGALLMLALAAWATSLPAHSGARRLWLDKHLLPYRLYLRYQSTVFMIILAAQMQAHGSMVEALQRIGRQASPWLRGYTDQMIDRLLRPSMYRLQSPVQALDVGLLHPDIVDRLELLAQSGRTKPEDAIVRIGLESGDKLLDRAGIGAVIVRDLGIVFVGMLVAWLLLTLQVPMGALLETIGNAGGTVQNMR